MTEPRNHYRVLGRLAKPGEVGVPCTMPDGSVQQVVYLGAIGEAVTEREALEALAPHFADARARLAHLAQE